MHTHIWVWKYAFSHFCAKLRRKIVSSSAVPECRQTLAFVYFSFKWHFETKLRVEERGRERGKWRKFCTQAVHSVTSIQLQFFPLLHLSIYFPHRSENKITIFTFNRNGFDVRELIWISIRIFIFGIEVFDLNLIDFLWFSARFSILDR